MQEFEAYKVFCAETKTKPIESDFLAVLRDEIENDIKYFKIHHGRRHKYADAVKTSVEKMIDWYKNGKDYVLENKADFVASHRIACVWCAFLANEL